MKLWHKIAIGAVAVVFVLGASGTTYVSTQWNKRYDHVEGPDLQASTDPAVIARGEYLVNGPAHCITCHVGSMEEFVRADAGERVPMRGGFEFALGPLAVIHTSNLTPDPATGIGRYSDRQLFRMLRHNIKPDGTTSLAVLMPFAMMADEDIVSIVSYLRSLEPVRNEVPPPQYTAMGKVIRTMAPPFKPVLGHSPPATAPAEAPTKERGEYIARYVANCMACHTNHDLATAKFIGPEYAGGARFEPMPGTPEFEQGIVHVSPNITPHPTTGVLARIGSKEAWITRFRQGRTLPGSPMHWGPFSRMSDADLEALWVYLNSLLPVENDVGPTVYRAQQ